MLASREAHFGSRGGVFIGNGSDQIKEQAERWAGPFGPRTSGRFGGWWLG